MKNKRVILFLYIITVVFFIFFAGLRKDTPDWHEYKDIFQRIVKHQNGSKDLGFNVIMHICALITKEPFFMFLVTAACAVIINGISIYRYTRYLFLALLLYFCHNYCLKEMIQIRVGLASAVCLFSLYYLDKKQLKEFFSLLIIAVSIHLTCAIFILAYIGQIFLNKKRVLYCVIISLFIGVFCPFGSILKTVIGIDSRLDDYIAYGDEGYAQSLGILTNINTIKCLIVFGFLYSCYDRLAVKNRYFKVLFNCYALGLSWLLCFNDFSIIGARMSNILISCEPILLTTPYSLFKRNSQWGYSLAMIALAVLIFRANIAPNKVIPYSFYFS